MTERIYREGHEIGNHTFTHPDISNISQRFMRAVELNLTEQLFASRLGIRTILFRPPYSIDAEPDTEDQVRPLEITQDMGYITVGDKIDPNDWRDNPRHSAEQIADRRAGPSAALRGGRPSHCGNIILLHDGGGDREQTVLALPTIIEGMRAQGIADCSALRVAGQDPGGGDAADSVQPALGCAPEPVRVLAVRRWHSRIMSWIFFVGDVLMTGRLLFIGAFAIYDRLGRGVLELRPMQRDYHASGRGADSCLQRRESHRADHSLGAAFRLIPICA